MNFFHVSMPRTSFFLFFSDSCSFLSGIYDGDVDAFQVKCMLKVTRTQLHVMLSGKITFFYIEMTPKCSFYCS